MKISGWYVEVPDRTNNVICVVTGGRRHGPWVEKIAHRHWIGGATGVGRALMAC
jgi:hypothetical protein